MSSDPYAEAQAALARHAVPASVLPPVLQMIDCIREAADDVANDTGDDRYDDSNGRGHLRYRRARNRMIEALDDFEGVTVDTSNNALEIRVAGVAISFYSAPHGVDQPQLGGATETRRRVVDQMQLQLELDDKVDPPSRLVLIHECDEEGLMQAALGSLSSPSAWSWHVMLANRLADEPVIEAPEVQEIQSYEELEETELPESELLEDADAEDIDQDADQ